MNRTTWTAWAGLLAAGLLGVTVAGCGGSSKKNPQQDGGIPDMTTGDMAVTPDASGSGDMATSLYIAQITVADVSGTVVINGTPTPGVHSLATQVSFPSAATPESAFAGCSVNRYDFAAGALPPSDVDSGSVSISGYSSNGLVAYDITSGTPMIFASPSPSLEAIGCAAGTIPGTGVDVYGCDYVTSDVLTSNVVFPPLGPTSPQILFPAGISILESLTAGTGSSPYFPSAKAASIALPSTFTAFTITNIAGASPSPAPGHSALELLQGQFDGSHDITIKWACDSSGTQCTPSSGPVGPLPTDLAGLLIKTQGSDPTKFGVAQCIYPVQTGTLTMPASQVATLLDSANTTGQVVQVLFVHVKAGLASISTDSSHLVVGTAGRGEFAFVAQTQ